METKTSSVPAFFGEEDIDVNYLASLCSQEPMTDDYPFAEAIQDKVVIYDGRRIRMAIENSIEAPALKSELNRCLDRGPGVLVVRNAYPGSALIDTVTRVFEEIIQEEKQAGVSRGDHFGANERIWNSLQKVCLKDPELFIAYYGDPVLAFISSAWLGPFYQITAQVNNVKPGSAAQTPHRDYHLGFQSNETIVQFPAQAQITSQYLTLQGAIAHTDMPLESGPTLFLPFSQQFAPGYLAFRDPDCIAFFGRHHVQLPLEKGDAVFFSPALFHGAGANRSSSDRMANLVQISSAFGRPMESLDRPAMIEAVYPVLLDRREKLGERRIRDVIAAVADGYSFPTNLDADPPVGGNAPKTAQEIVAEALQERRSLEQLRQALDSYGRRRMA